MAVDRDLASDHPIAFRTARGTSRVCRDRPGTRGVDVARDRGLRQGDALDRVAQGRGTESGDQGQVRPGDSGDCEPRSRRQPGASVYHAGGPPPCGGPDLHRRPAIDGCGAGSAWLGADVRGAGGSAASEPVGDGPAGAERARAGFDHHHRAVFRTSLRDPWSCCAGQHVADASRSAATSEGRGFTYHRAGPSAGSDPCRNAESRHVDSSSCVAVGGGRALRGPGEDPRWPGRAGPARTDCQSARCEGPHDLVGRHRRRNAEAVDVPRISRQGPVAASTPAGRWRQRHVPRIPFDAGTNAVRKHAYGSGGHCGARSSRQPAASAFWPPRYVQASRIRTCCPSHGLLLLSSPHSSRLSTTPTTPLRRADTPRLFQGPPQRVLAVCSIRRAVSPRPRHGLAAREASARG